MGQPCGDGVMRFFLLQDYGRSDPFFSVFNKCGSATTGPFTALYSIYSKVMDDDARNFTSGEFFSDARGKVPPLVTTKFITRDAGNSGMLVRKWIAGI